VQWPILALLGTLAGWRDGCDGGRAVVVVVIVAAGSCALVDAGG